MKEAPGSSETSVLTRATRRNNTEDTILHSHRRENLKSYMRNHKPWFHKGCSKLLDQRKQVKLQLLQDAGKMNEDNHNNVNDLK
jgi:hypothetical protein